jgi:ribosomal protein L7/L12
MADLQQIMEDLPELTVLEAADLAKLLEERWEKERAPSRLSDEEIEKGVYGP